MLKTCSSCGTTSVMHGMILCPVCADQQRLADESAHRAAVEASYESARARMAGIGCASFIPTTDTERRMHRQARSKVNFGYGGY